ncbi:hypothetical protein D3C83_51530 [compost metagenome]
MSSRSRCACRTMLMLASSGRDGPAEGIGCGAPRGIGDGIGIWPLVRASIAREMRSVRMRFRSSLLNIAFM